MFKPGDLVQLRHKGPLPNVSALYDNFGWTDAYEIDILGENDVALILRHVPKTKFNDEEVYVLTSRGALGWILESLIQSSSSTSSSN